MLVINARNLVAAYKVAKIITRYGYDVDDALNISCEMIGGLPCLDEFRCSFNAFRIPLSDCRVI